MIPTVIIPGSDEVTAPFGGFGSFIIGKRQKVRITAVGPDEKTPLSVRQTLVGMKISTIFTCEQLGEYFVGVVPKGARLAYAEEVIEGIAGAFWHIDPVVVLQKICRMFHRI